MKAIILSAGEGTRMRPLTLTKPKTMLPVAGKPIIQYNIEALRECGIKDILIIVGYKEEIVKNYFKDGSEFGVNIQYATQSKLEGTANAISYGKDFIEDSLIILNGDIILDEDIIQEIKDDYEKTKPDTLMVITEVEDPSAFGVVELDGEKIVIGKHLAKDYAFDAMIAWIIAGLPWDILHGISNFFCAMLIIPIVSILQRLERNVIV